MMQMTEHSSTEKCSSEARLLLREFSHPHGARKYPSSVLLFTGAGQSTPATELRSHGVCETPVIAPQHVELCFVVTGNNCCLVRRTTSRHYQEAPARTGTICLSPAEVDDNVVKIMAPVAESIHLYLPLKLFRRLNDDFNLPQSPAHCIRPIAGLRDKGINSTALSILSEITDETAAGRMVLETAALMLAAQILYKYSDSEPCALTAAHSHQIDDARIRRVLDYISANIAKEITVSELAGVAALSMFHFARSFTRTIGISPHRYVSWLRIKNAMTEIAAGRLPLAQIAFNARFASQASFTRAFHRATGMTPAEYRRRRRQRCETMRSCGQPSGRLVCQAGGYDSEAASNVSQGADHVYGRSD